MFLPRKKIIQSQYRQRGNFVIGVGLPPTANIPPVLGGPGEGPGWSLIEEWDVGDLPFIESEFAGNGCGDMLAWSPDGSVITLCSNSQDRTRSFSSPTP